MLKIRKLKSEAAICARLLGLYEREHGGCGQSTCDMAVSYRLGYLRWAFTCFSHSGAASEEFLDYYEQLPKTFHLKAEKERKRLCLEPHVDCPHCNAVLWLPDDCDYFCDSCAKAIPREVING